MITPDPATAPRPAAVAVRDLSVCLRRPGRAPYARPAPVLEGLSFDAPAGQVTVLVGSNGAGKTTALRAVAGALIPETGSIEVLGLPMHEAEARLPAGVAVVPDSPPYPGHWTAHDVARLHRGSGGSFDVRAFGATLRRHMVPLDSRLRDLSRGQSTQLLLAVALAGSPRLLILDEPLARLDPLAREDLVDRLRAVMAAGEDVSILLATHDLDGMDRFVDHLVVIADGACVLDGGVEELRDLWILAEVPRTAGTELPLVGEHDAGPLRRGLLDADEAAALPPTARLHRPSLTDLVTHALRRARSQDRSAAVRSPR